MRLFNWFSSLLRDWFPKWKWIEYKFQWISACWRSCWPKFATKTSRRVNGVKKLAINQGLRKIIRKTNLKSSNRLYKFIAKSWICIRVLPYMPPSISRKMIVFMQKEVESFPLSKQKLGFEEVLEKIHNDHNSATKLQHINWWSLLR